MNSFNKAIRKLLSEATNSQDWQKNAFSKQEYDRKYIEEFNRRLKVGDIVKVKQYNIIGKIITSAAPEYIEYYGVKLADRRCNDRYGYYRNELEFITHAKDLSDSDLTDLNALADI